MSIAPAAQSDTVPLRLVTPAIGLRHGRETYTSNAAQVPFYYAAPQAGDKLPTVLVVQEIFGLHDYIADTCRRLAHAGYLAIAPDLYFRQGDASQYSDVPTLMSQLVSRVPDTQVLADLDGAVRWAEAHGGHPGKVAITGFCWGGRITWLYCAHSDNVQCGVAWYGRLTGAKTDMQPQQPVDIAPTLKAPVLGLYGGQDAGIPLDAVQQMQSRLQAAGQAGIDAARASEIVVYPEAGHAFHADYRPNYRKDDAEDGFRRTLQWFSKWGVA